MKLATILAIPLILTMGILHAQNPMGDSGTLNGSGTLSPPISKDTVTAVSASEVVADSVVVKTSDSTAVKVPSKTITSPSSISIGGLSLPAWVWSFITALLTILPGIQLVLKRSPGALPIAGVVGKVLNFFTWFQDNIIEVPPPQTKSASPMNTTKS